MKSTDFSAPARQDYSLLRRHIFRLMAPGRLAALALAAILALLWYTLVMRLVDYVNRLDFDNMSFLGAEAAGYAKRYSPYAAGALAIIASVIVAWLILGVVRGILARSRQRAVDGAAFDQLQQQLSLPALDVLLWAWRSRDRPLNIQDLIHAEQAMTAGRATALQRAALQQATLENARERAKNAANGLQT